MERILFTLNGTPVAASDLLLAAAALALALLAFMAVNLARRGRLEREGALAAAERERVILQALSEFSRQSAGLNGLVRGMAEVLGSRQADLARLVSERLDTVGTRVGEGLEASSRSAGEQLAKLNERLAVIDAAQARVAALTQEVIGLKDILANKQARGAFGQGRLEGFTALKQASSEEARKQAAARVRNDVLKHVRDIAERYFIPDETQDIAVMFVPSEALFAELHEHFDDVIQKAHKNRIIIVSPSLLMMAVQVIQAIVRDAKVREEAHLIQAEVRHLIEEVNRLRARAEKLDAHFKIAQEDVDQVLTSAGKVAKRGLRIDRLDFGPQPQAEAALPYERAAE